MRVGIIGAGKLGLPVALAIESRGHDVSVYDINPQVAEYVKNRAIPYVEEGIQPLLSTTKVDVAKSIEELLKNADLVFVAVQTPHEPKYEGVTRIPNDRCDFDYSFLEETLDDITAACTKMRQEKTVAVISTCLPGTFERLLKQKLNPYVSYAYTPQFIAMGTVLNDYLHPEFNLIGVHDPEAVQTLQDFYRTINDAPHLVTDITTAEAIKVSYNTFITMKTVLANTWGELCHKVGANVDDLFKAWSLSTTRLLSPRYLQAGMGDGGGCHPRDNIALSCIAERENLSHNIFEDLMKAREDHAEWLAELCLEQGDKITVLGKAFKPETNIETGSPAVLVANILREKGAKVTHVEDGDLNDPVVFIGTKHERYAKYKFPAGTVVIDPFRYIPDQDDVKVIRIGE